MTAVPYREEFVIDDDRPSFFGCNHCGRDVTYQPCPDHAPVIPPGFRQAECTTTPLHAPVFDYDREDYGLHCPYCVIGSYAERERAANQCRHWAWRRWRITRSIVGLLYTSGITASGGGCSWGDGHDACLTGPLSLRGERPYILGIARTTWRCWLRGWHRRGEPVGFGFCGKCVPWPCCGSTRQAHHPDCDDAEPTDNTADSASWTPALLDDDPDAVIDRIDHAIAAAQQAHRTIDRKVTPP